jgi:hypothetical protein
VVARPEAPKWERRAASLVYYATARRATEAAWNMPGLGVEVLLWRAGGYEACNGQTIKADEGVIQAALIRDIFGNPWRTVTIAPAWRTATVQALAQAAYEERDLPSGLLNPLRLAILADALEEAGCTDGDIPGHLRGPNCHVRGCWVVDALAGKE